MTANKSFNKRITAIILLAIGGLCLIMGILGFALDDKIDPYEVRNGIAMVYAMVYDNQGNSESGWGTGWCIGKPGEPVEYIVTNGHVVDKAYTYPRYDSATYGGDIKVYFSAAENDYVQAKVVYFSPFNEKDIAILQLPTPTDKRTALTLRDSDSVSIGSTAYALGYPGDSVRQQDFVTYDKDDVTMTRGIISKRTTTNYSTYEAFQMDVSIAGGNSGGPLVDENGSVIGINAAGALDPNTGVSVGMNYAITINELVKILDSEHIDYTLKHSASGFFASWMGYVFVPVGVILLVLGTFMMLSSMGIFDKKAPTNDDMVKTAKVMRRGYIMGVTGKFAGQSFEITEAGLLIGRDPVSCNIVYEAQTPGISARHCRIAYNKNSERFTLTDVGSSYGTFLAGGRKLTPNAPEALNSGDRFYLCDENNTFSVTVK